MTAAAVQVAADGAVTIGGTLLHAGLHGGLAALAAWVLLAIAPTTPAWMRAAVWWLVTARFVLSLVPAAVIDLPILPEGTSALAMAIDARPEVAGGRWQTADGRRSTPSNAAVAREAGELAWPAALVAVVPLTLSARAAVPMPSAEAPLHITPATTSALTPAPRGDVELQQQEPPPPPPATHPTPPPPPPLPPPPRVAAVDEHMPWVLFAEGVQHAHVNAARPGDVEAARRVRQGDEALLWFRKDGRAYVIRDAAFIREMRARFDGVDAIGARMKDAGSRMEAVGSATGSEFDRRSSRMAALGAQQADLASRLTQLTGELVIEGERLRRHGATSAPDSSDQARMEQVRTRIDQIRGEMEQVGEQQSELGAEMRSQGDQLRAEGRQLEALGQQLRNEVEQARHAVGALLDTAVSSGRAQPVP